MIDGMRDIKKLRYSAAPGIIGMLENVRMPTIKAKITSGLAMSMIPLKCEEDTMFFNA